MRARVFWLRLLAWFAAMMAVVLVQPVLHQAEAHPLTLPVLALVVSTTVELQFQYILAYAAFAAAVAFGARGASWKPALGNAVLVGAHSLLLGGYLLPLVHWLIWGKRAVIMTWAPLRWALPAGAWPADRPGSDAAWWADVISHMLESVALLGALLTVIGTAVGERMRPGSHPARQRVLPWIVALALFASTRVCGLVATAAVRSSFLPASVLSAAFVFLAVPLAVLATLLYVRYAQAGSGMSATVQP